MKNILMVVSLCFSIVSGFSQNKIRSSNYIITNSGDTIYGEFNPNETLKGIQKVLFVSDVGNESTFKKGELFGLKNDGNLFLNKSYKNGFGNKEDYFLLELEGAVNVYSAGTKGYYNGNQVNIWYYLEINGEMIKVKSVFFKSQMRELFADDPVFVEAIEKERYMYSTIVAAIRMYNKNNIKTK